MQNTVTKMESPTTQLKDPRLFREACYVNGQWVQAASGQSLNVDNPATGEIIGTVPKLSAAETRQAIEAANRAFPAWRLWSRANLSPNQKEKSPTPPRSSNGLAKKPSASTETPFRSIKRTSALSSLSSPSESSRASRHGIFRWR